MKLPGKVIGCYCELTGEVLCEECRGDYFNSKVCSEIREKDDYQLISDEGEDEQVTVFMTIQSGTVDKLIVCDTPLLADKHIQLFLKELGYSNIDEYAEHEMAGHLKREFRVFTRLVQYEVDQ